MWESGGKMCEGGGWGGCVLGQGEDGGRLEVGCGGKVVGGRVREEGGGGESEGGGRGGGE